MDRRRPVRVGVLGAGRISEYHIRGLQEAGAEVVAVCARTLAHARDRAAQYGVTACTDRYEDVLARDDIDAVVVATPDFTHEELAVAAARAGKAILVQKPMARSSAECVRIRDAAATAGVLLCVSFMHRYFEEVTAARQVVRDGTLGRITSVRQRNATRGADWASWFYSKENVGGGVLLQLGVHGIDLARHLFGEIAAVDGTVATTVPQRRLADGSTVTLDSEDLVLATYRLASDTLVSHEVSWTETAGTDRFRTEIYGDEGTAWLRSERGRLAIHAPRHFGHTEWVRPELGPDDAAGRQHRHFIDMVRGDAPPDGSDRDGLASVLVAEAVYRAADAGRWEPVRWP